MEDVFGALLTEYLKPLTAFGMTLMLSNRKHMVSKWKAVEYGVPKRSILGPLFFNIHLCDLFYFYWTLQVMRMIPQYIL